MAWRTDCASWCSSTRGAGGLECVETIGHGTRSTAPPGRSPPATAAHANDLLISVVGDNASAYTVPSGWNSRVYDTTYGFAVADKLDTVRAGAQSRGVDRHDLQQLGYGLIVAFKTGGMRTSVPAALRPHAVAARGAVLGLFRRVRRSARHSGRPRSATRCSSTSARTWATMCRHQRRPRQHVARLFDGGYDTTGDGHSSLWVCRRCIGPAPTITLTATLVAGNRHGSGTRRSGCCSST